MDAKLVKKRDLNEKPFENDENLLKISNTLRNVLEFSHIKKYRLIHLNYESIKFLR